MTTLYDDCVARGVPTDHHESDLYLPVTPETTQLIQLHDKRASIFTSQVDGKLWYDVPFAYGPFWRKRGGNAGEHNPA